MSFDIIAPGMNQYSLDTYLHNEFQATYTTQPAAFTDIPGGYVLICILIEPGQYYQLGLRVDSQQELAELIGDTLDTNVTQTKTWMLITTTKAAG